MINKNNTNSLKSLNNFKTVEASVKWYNPEKGYGFLNCPDVSGDIMVHFSVLDAIGCAYIKVGDRVICEIASGNSGMQAVRVIEIKFASLEPRSLSGFLLSQVPPFDPNDLEEVEGVIKWYNPDKGYGFICPDDGRREIFLHTSVLRAAGYKFLNPGARVLAKVSDSDRGQEARMIRVLYDEEKINQEAI